jgi:hypothetical protein
MKVEDKSPELLTILRMLSMKYSGFEYNLTCIIRSIDDILRPDENPYAKTSLISIIFLSTCAGLTFALCFGWFTCSYYRRFKQRRIKIQLKKAMENSVQKFLKESPVISFNSKIKAQHFTDDDPMCAICLESFKDSDKIRKLSKRSFFEFLLFYSEILFKNVHIIFTFNVLILGY